MSSENDRENEEVGSEGSQGPDAGSSGQGSGQQQGQQGAPPPPPQGQPYYALPSIPNSTAVLVLGIISIVTCFCYGIPGMVCGIIALVLSKRGFEAYNANPAAYSQASYNNMNAGRVCAIIGVSLSGLYLVWLIFWLVAYGSMMMSVPWEEFKNIE